MTVTFDTIPMNLMLPGGYAEFNSTQANQGLNGMPRKLLLLGQKLAAGTGSAAKPYQLSRTDHSDGLFGKGSMLAAMARAALKANEWTEIWAIALDDDAGGVAGTRELVLAGNASQAGTQVLYVGGRRYQAAVASGHSAAEVATNLAAAVTADDQALVTASAAVSTITFTAKHKGVDAASIDVRTAWLQGEADLPGLTFTLADWTGAGGNPDVSLAIAAFGAAWWTDVVMPWTDTSNLNALQTELESRFGGDVMQDSRAFYALDATHGSLSAAGDLRNNKLESCLGLYRCPTPPWEVAAVYGAVCAFEATQDPARPLQTVELPGVMGPALEDQFTDRERNQLLVDGVSTATVDVDGSVRIERAVTTYKTNDAGADDDAYQDVEDLATLAWLRFDWRTWVALTFPRFKLAKDTDTIPPGAKIVRPIDIYHAQVARAQQWQQAGMITDVAFFKKNTHVQIDPNNNDRVLTVLTPKLIGQLRQVFARVDFSY